MTGEDAAPIGTLYVCATPIGNLGDVSARLREVLAAVDAIACEDTRRTRKLLSALEIDTPQLLSYRSDNEAPSAAGVVGMLAAGKSIALVSDAGTPAIADPGVTLVRAAREAGVEVVSVAGPSAVTAALSVSGLGATGHTFVAFFPRSAREVCDLVRQHSGQVLVGFESPRRLAATLAAVASVQPDRQVVVVREITKLHEQTYGGSARELAEVFAQTETLGEIVVVLDALPAAAAIIDARVLSLVDRLVTSGVRMKDACTIVADHENVSKRELYEAVLATTRDA